LRHRVCYDTGYRSNNFIVGLTNVNPLVSRPTLWNYTLCGQYPGAVAAGATATVYCPYNVPTFRYVVVQFKLRKDQMNICEVEVFATGSYYCAQCPCTILLSYPPSERNE